MTAPAQYPSSGGAMAHFMDQLVAESRSSRDAAFNALDSVARESKRATTTLAAQVERFVQVHETGLARILQAEIPRLLAERGVTTGDAGAAPAAQAPGRDTRFDPEDEWDLVRPAEPRASQPAARPGADDDDDDYPQTWLR